MRIAFWNVENLYDTFDDPATNDDDFTPQGKFHWNEAKYKKKIQGVSKTILALGSPMLMALAEVENKEVVKELCFGSSLRKKDYHFVHFDSPDKRGIDNALLYNRHKFHVSKSMPINMSDSSTQYYTRDILYVRGETVWGDTLILFINHFPSKRGGEEANQHREIIARRLRVMMDQSLEEFPGATVIALGDFNATPDEETLTKTMGIPGPGWRNLMAEMPTSRGSHKFNGKWHYLDQILVNDSPKWHYTPHVFQPEFLLMQDKKFLGDKPFRTYNGYKHIGGLSDHLPVYVDIAPRWE